MWRLDTPTDAPQEPLVALVVVFERVGEAADVRVYRDERAGGGELHEHAELSCGWDDVTALARLMRFGLNIHPLAQKVRCVVAVNGQIGVSQSDAAGTLLCFRAGPAFLPLHDFLNRLR